MAAIYGGDEVNAAVIDLGTCLLKAGYAGDDTPKAVFPSVAGVVPESSDANGMEVDAPAGTDAAAAAGGQPSRKIYVGTAGVNYVRDNMQIVSPFGSDGLLADWDIVEQLWSHAFKDRLSIVPEETALLLAEPTHNSREVREKMVELLFEKFNCPAMFLAKAAVLNSFAVAKQTSLVVDAGFHNTTVAAVHDGYVLHKTIVQSPVAGNVLTKCMLKCIQAKGIPVRPRQTFKRVDGGEGELQVKLLDTSKMHPSFLEYQTLAIAADAKEALCRTSDNLFIPQQQAMMPNLAYELPDGTEIQVGVDRFQIPELLFQPNLLKAYPGIDSDPALAGREVKALPTMVTQSIGLCDVDIRRDLNQNVVLTGGTALLHALKDRFERSLQDVAQAGFKVKVTAPINPTERRFSTWIGGSILASLGSFQQMWLSKQEFEEHGAGLIHRKSP